MKKILILPSLIIFTATLCMQGCGTASIAKSILKPGRKIQYLPGMEKSCLELINRERSKQNLPSLTYEKKLLEVARIHTKDMIYMECLTHKGSDNRTVQSRAEHYRIDWRIIGENVARNRGYDNPAGKAVSEWMKSKGHRENILNSEFTHTAIGIAEGNNDYIYFTQVFLKPMP
ncbi:MAG: CAP domain-containing protein [Planctomycetota bacterium]|jgi:uncharacterized protein YkwD